MPKFHVDVEGATYEVDAPNENTAWRWANTAHLQEKAASSDAPILDENGRVVMPAQAPARERSLGERLTGAGEAALTTGTGLTTGAAGMIGGTVKGLGQAILDGSFGTQDAANLVEEQAMKGAEAGTYAPRTQAGQEYAQNVGEVMAATAPLMGFGGELSQIGAGMRAAAPAVRAASEPLIAGAGRASEIAGSGAMKAVEAVRKMPTRAAEAVGLRAPAEMAQSGARPSIGAAGVDAATLRAQKAANLPVPVALTKGAETRNPDLLAFEKEQIKTEMGQPLRTRAEENSVQIMQNFDTLLDRTGAEMPDMAATGNKVVDALGKGYKAARNETSMAYNKAHASEEAKAAVHPSTKVTIGEGDNMLNTSLVEYLNSKVQGVPSSAVTDSARKIMIKMGLAAEDESGNLVGKPATVGKLEDFRREISGTAKWDDKTGIRDETILKKITDAQNDPVSGPLYKKARKLRSDQARKFEGRAIVYRLLNNRKGMDDPQVAVDQVFQKSIMNSSPEEITFLKRVLNTSGMDGKQAWKELQGATLKHIKDEATKGMGMDSNDNPLVSTAKLHGVINQLDKNNRLDIVLGKQNAQIVRDLNDVARYVTTVPPGTLVNTSGTSGAIMAAIGEAGATGALTGLPLPVISILKALGRQVKDNKMKIKINAALNAKPKEGMGF